MQTQESLLIYDENLVRAHSAFIQKFPRRMKVKSGESLKKIEHFPDLVKKILELTHEIPRSELTLVAMGGGSVGDFVGFVASVLKRGVNFVQIPTTWLAAMDSAHGGKTALNVKSYKNQIGTFYPASDVLMIQQILLSQPRGLVLQGAGEYYKTLLLSGPKSWSRSPSLRQLTPQELWEELPQIVKTKWAIVKKDPFETQGHRFVLNLGHTAGHIFEGATRLPHGVAVHLGLLFALRWSQQRGDWKQEIPFEKMPSERQLLAAMKAVDKLGGPKAWLLHDKKRVSSHKIKFIFMRKPGYPRIESVTFKEFMVEWLRQKKTLNSISKARSPHLRA